jgi:hypothetical protein
MEYCTDGLRCKEVRIEDGEISLETGRGFVTVGDLNTLLSLPPYHGGEYETENGLLIDVEQMIGQMVIPPKPARTIKHATPNPPEGEELSERMVAFNRELVSRLEADIKP